VAIDLFALRMNMEIGGAAQAKSALSEIDAIGRRTAQAMQGLGNDARLATAHFATGRIGLNDFRTAIAVAGEQAINLQGRFRGLATVAGGVFRGIGDTAVAGFNRVGSSISGFLGTLTGKLLTLFALRRAYSAVTDAADQFARAQLMLEGAARRNSVPLEQLQKMVGQVKAEFQGVATPVATELVARFMQMARAAGDLNLAAPGLRNFLLVGASVGMDANATLVAAEAAIRGIDDGTDKLFQMNPSGIWREYAASIGTTAGKLSDAEKMMSMFWKAQQVAASDPGAWQRFMESTIGKQATFNAKLLEAQAAFGTALAPLRLFAFELGTGLINGINSAIVGLTQGWGTLKSLFSDALPGIVQLGAGKTLLILADWAGSVVNLFARVGVNLGVGLVAAMGEAGARLVQAGRGNLAAFDAQRNAVNQAMATAAGGTVPVDMSPIVFPALPPGRPAPMSKEEQDRILGLANMDEAMKPADSLSFQGFPDTIATRNDRIDTSGSLIPRDMSVGRRRGQEPDWFDDMLRAGRNTNRQFSQLGTNLGLTLANGFAAALSAGIQGKNPFKAFGNVVLAGLGGIMTSMGQALIEQGVIFLTLLPALSNPFTSGAAMIAAGVALSALGATLGGIATGPGGLSGGGSGGASRDRVTEITLTADGLGGTKAPKGKGAFDGATLLSVDSPRGQRVIATSVAGASRRNIG